MKKASASLRSGRTKNAITWALNGRAASIALASTEASRCPPVTGARIFPAFTPGAITISGTSTYTSATMAYGIMLGYNANAGVANMNNTSVAIQSLGGGGMTLSATATSGTNGIGLNGVSLLANAGTITLNGGTRGLGFQNFVYSGNVRPVTIGSCASCDATSIATLGLYTGASTANAKAPFAGPL